MRYAALCAFALSLCRTTLAWADPATEIVVTGHKSTRVPGEATLATSRVGEQELARPGASAAAVLRQVPGVQVSETGASSELATASVRGASSAQTPVYLAGIRVNDDITGSANLSLVPLWMLGRVDVYRGNAPADADHLGIGGAIYFQPRAPRKAGLRVGAELGSFGERAGWVGAAVAKRASAALVAFRSASARNDYPYRDEGLAGAPGDERTRARPNADASERDLWAIGRTLLSSRGARVTTVFNAFTREQGVSGLATTPALTARAQNSRLLAGLSATVPCSASAGCVIALGSQASAAQSGLSDPRRELAIESTRIDSRGTRVSQSLRLLLSGSGLYAMLGANAEFGRLALDGAAPIRARRDTVSARSSVSASLGHGTTLSGLVLFTCDRTRGPDQSRDCANLPPEGRIGVQQKWGAFELRANLARYARVPTLAELYGMSAVVRGSSQLVAEQGTAGDLGARWEAQLGPVWAYVDAFGFARKVSHLVAFRRSSLGTVQPFNVGSARVLGAELESGAEWPEHLRLAFALTVLDPRDTTSQRTLKNDLVPYQSRVQSSLFVEALFDPGLVSSLRAGADARLSYRGSRLADPAGLLVLPASTALDLGASLRFGNDSGVTLRAAMDDVFDARRFDFIGYPVPGRRVHVSCEATW